MLEEGNLQEELERRKQRELELERQKQLQKQKRKELLSAKRKESKGIKTKHHRGRRKKSGKRNIVSDIILVIAVIVFVFSAFKLFTIFSEYGKGDSEYEHIAQTVIQQVETDNSQENDDATKEPKFVVDFGKLQEINADTVAWIRFDEPKTISYPVVKGPDNDKYLKTTFEGNRNAAGTLFIDVKNARDFTDKNTFIYGHNMKNGSMFGQLRKYKNISFCNENPYFYIYTPDGNCSKYEIFAAAIVKDTSETYTYSFADDNAYMSYLQYVKNGALYTTDAEVGADSKIVTLSTCTNVRDDERLVVYGVLIETTVAGE